jgi:hypothetical protein
LIITSEPLIREIERSEIDYMIDRMKAIQDRPDNPEGVEVEQIGSAVCYYSKTMPWASFNTVKGLRSCDAEVLDQIIEFYNQRGRRAQFEIVPSLVDQSVLEQLSDRGFYQSGFHTSLHVAPTEYESVPSEDIRIQEIQEGDFDIYATIHCRGTGLLDHGIPHVAQNNKVLFQRLGWKFYVAYYHETPAAVGVMYMKNGVASLTFAAALPEFRNKGLHQSLLRRRIVEASHNKCRLIVSQCSFLSPSHRNMERVGMKIGYVRASWIER